MATRFYTTGLKELLDGTIDLDTDTLKLILVGSGYTFDPDHLVADPGVNNATSPKFYELAATGYTKGWGGAGRKTPTITMTANLTNDRVDIALADLTWSAIGGAANDTIAAAILLKEGGANDTTSRLIAFFDLAGAGPGGSTLVTNGSDVTLDFTALGSGGNLRLAV